MRAFAKILMVSVILAGLLAAGCTKEEPEAEAQSPVVGEETRGDPPWGEAVEGVQADGETFLKEAAKRLTDAVGGEWRVSKRERASGLGPELSSSSFSTDRAAVPYFVFPFPLDETGKAKLKLFGQHCNAALVLLGSNEHCTVLAGPSHRLDVSRKIVRALQVSSVPESVAGYVSAWNVIRFSGQVTDRETGDVIEQYALQYGLPDPDDPSQIKWREPTPNRRKDSRFETGAHVGEGKRAWLRVVAEGYLPQPVTAEPLVAPANVLNLSVRLTRTVGERPAENSTVKKVEWFVDGERVERPRFTGAQQKIGDMTVGVTPLVISAVRDFADISSHFAATPLADKDGFMYAGTPTAGVPITTRPLTLFYIHCSKADPRVTLRPEKATLLDGQGNELSAIQSERIHASCPSWEFPLWREHHDAIHGFLVFSHLNDSCARITVRLPYSYADKEGMLLYKFGRKVLQEPVPRIGQRTFTRGGGREASWGEAVEEAPEEDTEPTPSGWGEAVEGVQVRLRADKKVRKMGEVPTLKAIVRNLGEREIRVPEYQGPCKLEMDGRWFNRGAAGDAKYMSVKPSKTSKDIVFSLKEVWFSDQGSGKRLSIEPGRHTFRVAIPVAASRVEPTGPGKRLQIISNPVEITIERGLPGSELSIEDAVRDPRFAFAAVCEALGVLPDHSRETGMRRGVQKFKILEVLAGAGPDAVAVELRYTRSNLPDRRERSLRKGERVIWIVRKRDQSAVPPWEGAKALPDTPENRQAVIEAVKGEAGSEGAAGPDAGEERNEVTFHEGARVTLELEKPEYFLGENILVHYCLENTGKEPFKISVGGDYRGSRARRFKVRATGEHGKPVDDPDPSGLCFGGRRWSPEVKPGETYYATLPLTRYCRFEKPGVYTIRAVHDLGWHVTDERKLPVGETKIKLVTPTPQQARQVVEEMYKLPKGPNGTVGQKSRPYADFTALWYPVYLPILLEHAQGCDEDALRAIGHVPTPKATKALIGLLDNKNRAFVLKVAGTLNLRLPEPEFHGEIGPWEVQRRWLISNSWRPEFAPQILTHAREILSWDGADSKAYAGFILHSLGGKDDLPYLVGALDYAVAETQNSLRRENSYPEPAGACRELLRAAEILAKRGAEVPTNPQSPGQAVVFLAALKAKRDFRPGGWQATALALLKHEIPYVRQLALQSLPRPLSKSFVALLPTLLADADVVVRIQACRAAEENKAEGLQEPILKIVASAKDTWLLRAAHKAARATGGRAESLELLASRFDDTETGWECFYLVMSSVIKSHGSGGKGALDSQMAEKLKGRWSKFLQDHRQAIKAGRRFEVGDPELTADLMPPEYKIRLENGKQWP